MNFVLRMNKITNQVKKIFDPYYSAPLETWETFAKRLRITTFKKNAEIKFPNTTEKKLYIINKGSAGIFLWNKNHPICIDLCFENDFFGDYMSLLTQKTTPLYTVCFEETEMYYITYIDLMDLYENSEFGSKIGRVAAESLFIHKQAQQIELLTKTAEQRYRQLLDKQLYIVQRVPLKHIASYLGINAESLSRIRKKIMR